MRLFIAEKPALAQVIAEALGDPRRKKGYIECGTDRVTWCIGHLLQLAPPESHNPRYAKWDALDLPLKLRPAKYVPIADTQDQFDVVCELISQANEIVHAGDVDDEGQLLVDEVLSFVENKRPVMRILISDLNKNAAVKALANLKDNREFFGLSEKARARSIGDQLYGFNMTRAYTIAGQARGVRGVLSVGRVQTTILGLVVARYLANKNHASAGFFKAVGKLEFGGKDVSASLQVPEGAPVDEKGRIIDEAYITSLSDACRGQQARVSAFEVEPKQSLPPLPFALLDLQAHMSQEHGISSDKTLAITQSLRENHKAITYNRSDCSYLSSEQFAEAPITLDLLAQTFPGMSTVFAEVESERMSRAFNDSNVSAHTAIIPTPVRLDLEKLSAEEVLVYTAIVNQYVAQFMPEKTYLSAKVTFDVMGNSFVARSKKTTAAGWSALLSEERKSEDDGESSEAESPFEILSAMAVGQTGACSSVVVSKEKTKPPALYTEASLLKDLRQVAKYVTDPHIKKLLQDRDEGKKDERGGIGTPATRAAMLAKLQERGYCAVEAKKFVPTKLGLAFCAALPEIATKPDMTALWHEQQQRIERGELTVDAFLDELERFIAGQISMVDLGNVEGSPQVSAQCPMCGGAMRTSAKTVGCSNCEFRLWQEMAGKTLTIEQINILLTKGRTGVLKGFKSGKTGKLFDASLRLDATGQVQMEYKRA